MGQQNSDAVLGNSGSDVLGQRHKTNPNFNIPGVFVGFSPKLSESDSVRSPTSPLDFRAFSNLTHPVRSLHEDHRKRWNPGKVGLCLIDTLDDDDSDQKGKIIRSSESKNVLFGPQMWAKVSNLRIPGESSDATKSLPKNCGVFPSTLIKPSDNGLFGNRETIRNPELVVKETPPFAKTISCSLDSGSAKLKFGSANRPNLEGPNPICDATMGTFSAEEIELSEDYTCIKTYGPNPKTTHIFCDYILECNNKNIPSKIQVPASSPCPSGDFLRLCYSCKKKLECEDIYMYRGEKGFCSLNCRSQQILIEEAMEKNPPETDSNDESSGGCIFIAA